MAWFSVLKRLAIIVWKDGGLSWLWLGLSALPTIIDLGTRVWPESPKTLASVSWWWGIVVVAVWVIFSLSRRILAYETPAIEIRPYQAAQDGSWWLDIVNTGRRVLGSCVLNMERLENESGRRVFPQSFGISERPNPFPLRGMQPKQARFASLEEGKIVLHLTGPGNRYTRTVLEDDRYTAVLSVYSEAEGAHTEKRVTLLRGSTFLNVS
jgi:hypothetical protein